MRLNLVLATAIIGTALALPSISSAAQTTTTPQDFVSLTEGPAAFAFGTIIRLDATSGPSGENPSGELAFAGTSFSDGGQVTCLAVSGNSATLNFESVFLGVPVTVHVVDDDPDTISILVLGRAATDCSPPPEINVSPLTSGDITVVDAQPLPTSRTQCKHGGWRQFDFKNQGQCIRFVNHGAKK
jgi:hypothetical protein